MEQVLFILTILGIHLLAVASPGPDFVVAVRNSLNFGRRAGVFTAAGFGLGIGVHLIYCFLGVALLISQSPVLFNVIKMLGAIYLLYIAYQIYIHRDGFSGKNLQDAGGQEKKMGDFAAFKSGFMTNVLNPKATLFFLGLFSTAIPVDTDFKILLVIGFFLMFNTFLWFAFVANVFTKEKSLQIFVKYAKYINIGLAVLLTALSIKILLF